jgi:glycosyltransferase involved in cell wall biosynthesis
MDPDRVYVVRSGPSLERMKVSPPNPVWKNGRKYMVGYVGVMGQQEGIDHLLEAARILVYDLNRQDIQFCLIGGGTELNRMQDMSVSYGLKDYVTFTGRIPDQHMLEILSTADVCVNPDKANPMNDKSTMNKVMEYMALGKPIVQYDLTEGRFSARAASVYARPNDVNDLAIQIQSLLDDPEKRMQMGSFGQKRVYNELHWGIESRKYLTAYDKLSRLT